VNLSDEAALINRVMIFILVILAALFVSLDVFIVGNSPRDVHRNKVRIANKFISSKLSPTKVGNEFQVRTKSNSLLQSWKRLLR
jgi:hypothetical protein